MGIGSCVLKNHEYNEPILIIGVKMNDLVLVLNCGSSSIKFAVIDPQSAEISLTGLVERIGSSGTQMIYKNPEKQIVTLENANHDESLKKVFAILNQDLKDRIKAIGHRVVHGGEYFKNSAIINQENIAKIEKCIPLAPLHNPANVLGIKQAMITFPNLKQVAVFDTAFHQNMPQHSYLYPVPYEWYEKHNVRRYGFHGTSHHYVTMQAAESLDIPYEESAFISAHLGNGCSVAAVLNGKSIDTSMGITPLAGLMMGTRSGDVDPSLHQYVASHLGLDLDEVTNILNKQSGLLGISGISNDMRTLEEEMLKGNKKSRISY
jgi:acetate kinase